MACLDDVVDILSSIQVSLTAFGGCGCGSSGAPAASPPIETLDTGDITQPAGTPPEGYNDWASYQQRKCDVADWIVTNMLQDLQWVQNLGVAGLTVGALAAGFAGFISANVLLLILSVLLAILAYDQVILQDGENAIQNNFDDLICALVTGTNAQDSLDQFTAEINDAVDAETTDPTARTLLKSLLPYWADTTSINLLYAPEAEVDAVNVPTGGNCSACGLGCNSFFTVFGQYLGNNTWQSEDLGGGVHYIGVQFNDDTGNVNCAGICGDMWNFTIENVTGWTPYSSPTNSWRIWSDAVCPFANNADVYNSDTQPGSGPHCGRRIQVFSNTPWTMDLVKQGECT